MAVLVSREGIPEKSEGKRGYIPKRIKKTQKETKKPKTTHNKARTRNRKRSTKGRKEEERNDIRKGNNYEKGEEEEDRK